MSPVPKRLAHAAEALFPGAFALVMATGIVSIAAAQTGHPFVARALLGVNVVAYALLVGLLVARIARWPDRVLADLRDHARGPGFFTLVAGTNVLGSQLLLVGGLPGAARALWTVGAVLWALVTYTFLALAIVREGKPTLEVGLNGGWLLAVVATQSVSVLGALLAPVSGGEAALFAALCLFLVGAALYGMLITLIFYRLVFLPLTTDALTPPYWINMGAVAITTLAGATLLLHADAWPLLALLRPFLTGFTLLFWALATWWIPLLVLLGVWRHLARRHPVAYDPQYWGMVFPLGMYTVATLRLGRVTGLPFLQIVPQGFVWVALAAWATVFAGLVRSVGVGRR